jgi:dTDP-4-dehydrorhamnose 3,5-epimerase
MAEPLFVPTRIAETYGLETAPAVDERGWVGELLRSNWVREVVFLQWNVVHSVAGTLRGMHWHEQHHDLIAPLAGTVLVGLADLRQGSPSEGQTELLELVGTRPAAIVVPPGVAHGLYCPETTTLLYAVSQYWDPADEFGVAFDDPDVGVPWPVARAEVILSERDRALPVLAELTTPPYAPALLV